MGEVLFLHGYGRGPGDYRGLVRRLERGGHRVHAPFLYGNHALERPPLDVAEALERTLAFVGCEGLDDYSVVGHSTGAGIGMLLAFVEPAPREVVALCPIRSVSYRWPGFVLRSARMNLKHWLGLSGAPAAGLALELRTSLPFTVNMLRRPRALVSFLRALVDFELDGAVERLGTRGRPAACPLTHVHAAGDEFFDLPAGYRQRVERLFPRLDWVELDTPSHEWCLLDPARAAGLVLSRLGAPATP